METVNNNNMTKDTELWKFAKKKATFKYVLLAYFVVSIFFWTLWYINPGSAIPTEKYKFPWPLWPMLFWGLGIFFNYIEIYKNANFLAQREYNKLKNKQQ